MKNMKLVLSALVLGLALISIKAYSDSNYAAVESCADADRGDACTFTNDKGDSLSGSCQLSGGEQSKLVCVPYQQ